ncbi:MAG TPA: DUF962 domain-containing protein [Candidatus Dormibacteraeota bacterium]|nr:DUF962 domain-containing protein [Candidatus Dormibacteraeota bacterium]
MSEKTRFSTFEEFFPFYCGEHSKPLTRWLHFAGTHAAGAIVATAVARRSAPMLLAAPVVSYGTAWAAHLLVEHNRPATFTHPLWSLRGDFVMIGMMWKGRDPEIQTMADRALTQRPLVLAPVGTGRAPAA